MMYTGSSFDFLPLKIGTIALIFSVLTISAQQLVIKPFTKIGNSPVYHLELDEHDRMYAVMSDSIVVINPDKTVRKLPVYTGGFALSIDENGIPWIPLRNQLVFNARNSTKYPYTGNHLNQCSSLFVDEGRMYMGTGRGLRVFDIEIREKGFLLHERSKLYTGDPIVGRVNEIIKDEKSTIWIATDNGLYSLSLSDAKMKLVSPFHATAIELHDGHLYVASLESLWVYKDMKKWKKVSACDVLTSYRIEDIAIDHAGSIWLASNVLAVIDTVGNCQVYSAGDGFTSKHATTISVDRDGHLWVGTEGKGIFEVYFEDHSENPEIVERYEFMGDAPHNNLVLLLDVSTSMKLPHKLPQLKRAVKTLSQKMRPEDEISIVTFSGNGELLLEAVSSVDNNKIQTVLDEMEIGGRSNVKKGLEMAFEYASLNFKNAGSNQIIIATDGEFELPSQLLELADTYNDNGIELSVLDFGEKGNSDLRKLSRKGGGKYRKIKSTSTDLYYILEDQVRN